MCTDTWFETFTGLAMLDCVPDPAKINIADIAHALANTCRFGGHCREFCSVAQHSVLVSQLVPKERALAGLLHDAHEAYTGDIKTPVKRRFPMLQDWEEQWQDAIAEAFAIRELRHPSVKHADGVALCIEARDLMASGGVNWAVNKFAGEAGSHPVIEPWAPEKAKQEFLRRFEELT